MGKIHSPSRNGDPFDEGVDLRYRGGRAACGSSIRTSST
jgi:hypothetical protein